MLDEYQNISLIFLLVDYILVVVCLCTDNYLIKIRIQWSDLCLVGFFFFLIQFWMHILDNKGSLYVTLSHVPILTL